MRSTLITGVAAAALIVCAVTVQPAQAQQPDALAQRVAALEAREAIRTLWAEYGRTLDARDFVAFSKLWAKDAEFGSGPGSAKGPDAIGAFLEKAIGTNYPDSKGKNFHLYFNESIDVQGNRASAISKGGYVMATADNSKADFLLLATYRDEFVREDGRWKFQRRQIVGEIPVPRTLDDEVMEIRPDAVRQVLASALPGFDAQRRMAPRFREQPEPRLVHEGLRHAAGLVSLYRHNGAWHLPLTLRGSTLRHHTGQVSLPGGRLDDGETVEDAALREAYEEIGVAPGDVDTLGRLTPLPIPASGHLLHPVVGVAARRPDFSLHAHEVEALIEAPLAELARPEAMQWETRQRARVPELMDVPYFDVGGAHVWGATAMVLAELLAVLEAAARVDPSGGVAYPPAR